MTQEPTIMVSRNCRCDTDRLRLSLGDGLSETEQAELAGHLESCAFCRQELEQMAATSQFWGDARLLGASNEPGTAPTFGPDHDALDAAHEEEEPNLESAWLRMLDPPDPEQRDILGRLGAYEVLEVQGQGGMGVVLKARDPALDRMVAIKVLTPALAHGASARRRFAREARAAAAVGHEHIVAIHAVDEFRGLPYLVMQYIPGRSLQERIDASGPLEVKEILRIGTQAARALAAAHAQGVVHRDIKPANILLENCVERVKLTDFGLARAIDDASLTQSGVIAGTPQYMAPEQARGEPVDARADLFSLGAVLYAMAAGRPPFRADSAMAVLKRVCEDRHRSIRELNSEVPDWLEAVIDRLLAKDPAHRFQSATEVADLLERGLAHIQQPTVVPRPVVSAPAAMAPPQLEFDLPAAKAPRHHRRLTIAAGLILAGLAGLGASEASGLTQVSEFVATILRIKTPEGTLVVNVDDPSVKVDVDNEMVIIGGAGPQEVRLRIGKHHVQATRNGQPVKDEMISIMKGKKEIVTIGFEPDPETAAKDTNPVETMAAPRSHENQCIQCHMTGHHVELGSLPTKHPRMQPFDAYYAALIPHAGSPQPAASGHPIRSRALVWSLAFSPDGGRLAIGQQGIDGRAGPLRIWDISGRRDIAWLARLSAYRGVAFSPDGKTLAAGSLDGGLTLLDAEIGKPRQLEGYQGSPINALAFLPDGSTIAAASSDGKVRFWNVATQTEHLPLRYPDRILALAVSPDGRSLAVAGQACIIQVYEMATGRLKTTLWGSAGAVDSLDFSPDGKLLASADNLTVRIWDTST
jgi:tRNA A-37 threonylcarbamoyl transferase component Bud32